MSDFDVIVVGAGHAGIEAARAAAAAGGRTLCVTLRRDRIGHLPCNCSIGGPAKGHIVREVDALGGLMAVSADRATTHVRRVGTGKGPSVQTIRAQVCKALYPRIVRQALETCPGLEIREGRVERILVTGNRITGAVVDGVSIEAGGIVLATGTFLNAVCHEGDRRQSAARHGEPSTSGLTEWLEHFGIPTMRFKTGTTPRISLGSIHFDQMVEMPSEPDAGALSELHSTRPVTRELLSTWRTSTNAATHGILRENLGRSAMYGGQIEGVGPRYCPSVEDKVVRFEGKESHPVFLEIEEWDGESVYVQGFSTSMPAEVQLAALRTIRGLSDAEMLRPGYAVEYDVADPTRLSPSLMSKDIDGLFLAGQLNGTSGYEEAAGQGVIAGLNAARYALGEAPELFPRHESFIGVMIDDLVTKGVEDPYRMLTARAEHRLALRHDNADQRLTPLAGALGLATRERVDRYEAKMQRYARARTWADETIVRESEISNLAETGLGRAHGRATIFEVLKRPAGTPKQLATFGLAPDPPFHDPVWELVEIEAKYAGYLKKQAQEIALLARLERHVLPVGFDYAGLVGLSHETREKLTRVRPVTVGQASRVPGVRPTDIALIVGHLRNAKSTRA